MLSYTSPRPVLTKCPKCGGGIVICKSTVTTNAEHVRERWPDLVSKEVNGLLQIKFYRCSTRDSRGVKCNHDWGISRGL